MSNKTYTEISANLQSWLEDDDAEFAGDIDDVINLGEMRVWRDLDLSIWTSSQNASTAASTRTVAKPVVETELVAFDSIYYTAGSGETVHVEERSADFVRDYQVTGTEAAPRYYAHDDETNIIVAPIPDGIYVLQFVGSTRPTRLSAGNPTTWLSLHQDDLLFHACLVEAEKYLKSDDRIDVWKSEYQDMLPKAKAETYTMMRARYQLTPLHVPAVPVLQR